MNPNDSDEIEQRKGEFFGYAESSQPTENYSLPRPNYETERTKGCPFCSANIGANALFCVHCSRQLETSEVVADEVTDITWGENGAVFNQSGGRNSNHNQIHLNNEQTEKNYCCPQCRSEQIQSFQMAYRAGTSQSSFYGSGHSFEAGSVSVSGTSHNQTYLAGLTSPPSRPRPFLLAIIATFVIPFFSVMPLLMAYFISPFKFGIILLIDFGLVATVYVLCGIFAPVQWKKHRQRYAEWERAWICLRCGHTFYIK
jgi:hypothetical protein